jgi:sugar/nucleoside kinase (ribokinase family)
LFFRKRKIAVTVDMTLKQTPISDGRPIDCLVVGDAFYDIIAKLTCSSGFLVDGGTAYCDSITTFCGGSANVAVGVSQLGGTSGFIGMLGRDLFGNAFRQDLATCHVQDLTFASAKLHTGVCISFVAPNGERSFLMDRGANDSLSSGNIEEIADKIAQAKILYVSGYCLVNEHMREAVDSAVEIAIATGTKILFDPASHNLIKAKPKIFMSIAEKADYLCLNVEEAAALTAKTTIDEMVSSLNDCANFVALKRGADGCIISSHAKTFHIEGEKVACVDTTGAGDCFASAVAFGLTHGLSEWAIGKLGNLLAGYKVQHLGARVYPPKEIMRQFLKNAKNTNA